MSGAKEHRMLTQAAFETLPPSFQRRLEPIREALIQEYCLYGDTYYCDPQKIGPYVEMPDGRLPMDAWERRYFRKDGPGKDFYICGYYDLMRYSFEYFAGRCIDAIRSGMLDDFARFAGTIIHVIEDCGAPAHAAGTEQSTDLELFRLINPTADKLKKSVQLHAVLENNYLPFSLDYRPRLQGITASEISFNLLERFTDMLERAIGYVIPVMNAFYDGDEQRKAELLTECARGSAQLAADFLYSTISAGLEEFLPEDLAARQTVHVGSLTPRERTAWLPPPYQYAAIRDAPYNLDVKFLPVPLAIAPDTVFENGIGIGAPFEASYILPDNCYREFSCIAAINAILGSPKAITLSLYGDNQLLNEVICGPGSNAEKLDCNISRVKKLTLKSSIKSGRWTENLHLVIGNPLLIT